MRIVAVSGRLPLRIWTPMSMASLPIVRGLCEAASRQTAGEVLSVGRDGASDAASFIEAGIPAVEFGPEGGGHHGPDEWVSLRSLAGYRPALGGFVRSLRAPGERALRSVQGGRG